MLQIYDRDCLAERLECRIIYSGHVDSIHLHSSVTAVGDEIGHDFIKHVTESSVSITSFVDIISSKYTPPAEFMSRQTFTDYVFSWLASFRYDFRQVCDICGTNPKILACDGTKLGMFFKNSFVIPIESPTCDMVPESKHTRTERQFFSYSLKDSKSFKQEKRLAMTDLEHFIALRLCNPTTGDNRSESSRKTHLLNHTPKDCALLIEMFIESRYPQELMEALCPILKVLSTSSPLTSIINYRFLDHLHLIIKNSGNIMESNLAAELPELCKILQLGERFSEMVSIRPFVLYLISQIRKIHEEDILPSSPSVVQRYNPETQGRAYYFTEHGGRVRNLPNYKATAEDSSSTCRKAFQDVTKGGLTFLFLWFDPLHGHCYGCHIITQSEGRKDPFASALLYMDSAPSEVFYDFSCQLEEYCLNREPGFWRNTRFFHDIFHGYSHKCANVYNSKRIPALDLGINSEICEQFNSYIQKIKYSARSMNQSHFMFFMQFFIHHWNVKKKKKLLSEQEMVRKLMAK